MSGPGPSIVLIRHGETEWSRNGRHTGSTDLALTPTGEAQARTLGAALDAWKPFALVLSSPLVRARRTAELAGLTPNEIIDDLREWDYGKLEGRTTTDIADEYPGWSIWTGPWPGGERPEQVAARADRVVSRVIEEPAGARVAVVAHGHLLRVLAARWLGGEAGVGKWLALGTGTLSELGWEHETRVINQWNLHPVGPGVR